MDTFTQAQRSRIMAAVRATDTAPEMVVRRMVHSLGYRYRLHVRELPGTPDLIFPRHRKIIDVRGCFWHGHSCGRCRVPRTRRGYWRAKIERNSARDERTIRKLRRAGWRVLVVWECATVPAKRDALRRRILRFLERD
ncbi:MAG: very short patch repair endonuclease [Planctomycetales bacterium]